MKKCKLMTVTFWDHCNGDATAAKAIKCSVVGWLFKESNLSYYLAHWVAEGDPAGENSEVNVILKSTVIKKRVFNAK